MAKSSVFAVFLFLSSFVAKAQNPSTYYVEDPRTFTAGLVVGANFAQVDGDAYAGYHKVGLNAGGIVYVRIADNLAASMEILFSQKGAKANGPQVSGAATLITDMRIDLNYAEVPLMLNLFDKRRSHFGAGFSYSRLISAKEVIETTPLDPNLANIEQYAFKKSDYNFLLGGNLHLWKGLFLNARFQYSLIPVRTNIPPGYGRRNEQYNNMWTVRLMYLF